MISRTRQALNRQSAEDMAYLTRLLLQAGCEDGGSAEVLQGAHYALTNREPGRQEFLRASFDVHFWWSARDGVLEARTPRGQAVAQWSVGPGEFAKSERLSLQDPRLTPYQDELWQRWTEVILGRQLEDPEERISPEEILSQALLLRSAFGPDTLHPSYEWDPQVPGAGHCGAAALAVHLIWPKRVSVLKGAVDRRTHYLCCTSINDPPWNNRYFDLTADQCGGDPSELHFEIPYPGEWAFVQIKDPDTHARAQKLLLRVKGF